MVRPTILQVLGLHTRATGAARAPRSRRMEGVLLVRAFALQSAQLGRLPVVLRGAALYGRRDVV